MRYAAGRGLPVAVQATGHGLPGPAQGGVLVTTRRMDGSELDVATAAELLARTGPEAGAMTVVQINHLGGALARPAPNSVPHREGRFLVRLLTMGDRKAARARLDPAFALLAPTAIGRALDFAFGAGDRTEGLYDAGTRKRLAGLKSQYDPANLFRRNYGVSA